MNNLRFRAWDKNKEMFTNYQIVDNMLYFMDKITGVWKRDDNKKRFVLMQSTGLKDRTDKEIFEKDIVRGVFSENHEVVWRKEQGCWVIQAAGTIGLTELAKYNKMLEVVGNIYENKDLI